MKFAAHFLRQLAGHVDTYPSVRIWWTKCVFWRVVIAVGAALVTFALIRNQTGFGTVARETMVYLMIALNAFITMFLTFGAGRNYERSRIAWESCGPSSCD